MLSGLVWSAEDAGLVDLEAFPTSPVSMAYAVAWGTALVATLAASVRSRRRPGEGGGETPRTGPVWHESTLFTDPWYQIPATFCLLVLASLFVRDLIAAPPANEKAAWFLASLGIATAGAALGITGGSASKRRAEEKTKEGAEAEPPSESESPIRAALGDPWFRVPAVALAFLHIARSGLEKIEEDPESFLATVWLLFPMTAVIAALVKPAVSRKLQERKQLAMATGAGAASEAEEVSEQSVRVTEEDG